MIVIISILWTFAIKNTLKESFSFVLSTNEEFQKDNRNKTIENDTCKNIHWN